MKKEIESFLRKQEEGEESFLKPAEISEAGREHLLIMRKNAEDEATRSRVFLTSGQAKPSYIPGVLAGIEKFETLIRDIDETVAESIDRYVEFVKVGETESYATFGTKFEGSDEWKTFNVYWDLWELLGSPQVIKIPK